MAQAITTFAMGCFDLTKELCDQISMMIGKYWWSQQEENKIHWISWEKLTMPKCKGGLGFRDIYTFNLAILGKQGWRLVQNPDSLCVRIYSTLNISPMATCSKPKGQAQCLTHGEAYCKEWKSWRNGWFGELVMEIGWTSGRIPGCREELPEDWSHREVATY